MAFPQERQAVYEARPSLHLHPALEDTLDGVVAEPTRLCLHPALLPQRDDVPHRRVEPAEPPVVIHCLEGVVIDEDITDSLSVHSHFLPREEEQEEDDVVEIHPWSSSPVLLIPHSDISSDQTRPSFVIGSERDCRLREKKDMEARDARVAVSGQCFQPVPSPIARCSGPMTVIRVDRLAALTNFQAEEEEEEEKGDRNSEHEKEEDTIQPLSEYAGVAGWVGVDEIREPFEENEGAKLDSRKTITRGSMASNLDWRNEITRIQMVDRGPGGE
ncbi:uncharacterized protein PG998_002575 [Apiospora kogelbergensis]|uniref:uncharacterized protein n=1 Tax=Apiospora kogelbergensis TaxID=1337665 RepID=UPI00312E63AA